MNLKAKIQAAANRAAIGPNKGKSISVDQTVDGKKVAFTGTLNENKRKAVMNVSNQSYGSTKTVEKFNSKGGLKSQKIVDKNTDGKTTQVTKTKVDKTGNMYSKTRY